MQCLLGLNSTLENNKNNFKKNVSVGGHNFSDMYPIYEGVGIFRSEWSMVNSGSSDSRERTVSLENGVFKYTYVQRDWVGLERKLASMFSCPLDDEDIYCGRSNILRNVEAHALYTQRDLNKMTSNNLVTKDYDRKFNMNWRVGTKMRGRTSFGNISFPFPVMCSVFEMTRFLAAVQELPREDRIAILRDGTIASEDVARLYARVFPRFAEPYGVDIEDVFAGVEYLSTIMLIFDAICRKDLKALGLLFTQQIRTISIVADYMNVDFSQFAIYVIDMFNPDVGITTHDGNDIDWVKHLPGVVRQSPLVQQVIAFAIYLMSAQFVTDSSLWQYFNQLVNPKFFDFGHKVVGMTLAYGVVKAIWDGYRRMEHWTDYESLLGLSKDASFTAELQDMQVQREGSCSQAYITSRLLRIDELFLSRRGLKNSVAIERLLSWLVEEKKRLYIMQDQYKVRIMPTLIWLNGPPGSGKTSLAESMINYLGVRDGVERKNGDRITYNINDKYPVETGACYDARYLVLNDIGASYASFQTEGKVPLCVLLQQLFDTAPLTFQSAFEKGVIFSNIHYVFITSNHYSYVMASETEKLQRRLDEGIIFDVGFGNSNFQTVRSLPVEQRNNYITFTRMVPTCKNLHVSFTPDVQRRFKTVDMFPYLTQCIDNGNVRKQRDHDVINVDGMCACGLAKTYHYKDGLVSSLGRTCDLEVEVEISTIAVTSERFSVTGNTSPVINASEQSATQILGVLAMAHLAYTCWINVDATTKFQLFAQLVNANSKIYFYGSLAIFAGLAAKWFDDQRKWFWLQIEKYSLLALAVYRVKKFVKEHGVGLSLIGVTSIAGMAMMSRRKSHSVAQGVNRQNYDANSLTTSVVAVKQVMATNNRSWARTDPVPSIVLQTHHVNGEDLVKKVRRATKVAVFGEVDPNNMSVGKCMTGHVFFVSGEHILVNKHYFNSMVGNVYTRRVLTLVKIGEFENFVNGADVKDVKDSELCIIPNHFQLESEDLSKYLPGSHIAGRAFDCIYVPLVGDQIKSVASPVSTSLGPAHGDIVYDCLKVPIPTDKGDCGQPLVGIINNEAFIAGLLFAGTATNIMNFHHSKETFFAFMPTSLRPSLRVITPEVHGVEGLDNGSELYNFPCRNLLPIGTCPDEGKSGFRTSIRKSRLYDDVEKYLSQAYTFPTKLAGNISTTEGVYEHGSAWKHTFKRFDLNNIVPQLALSLCGKSYAMQVCGAPPESLAPLSLEEAFFGQPSIGVDGFPMNTSAGPHWRKMGYKKKSDLFVLNEATNLYEILPVFVAAVQRGLDNLDSGVVVAPHVEFAAKDEVRPSAKVDVFNIRLFSVVDADFNVLVRMYLMPVIVYMMKHKELSECYGQMHAASAQWTDLKNNLTETGFTHFADMDFSAFDTCHDIKVFTVVSEVLEAVALHVGYSVSNARKVRFLVRSMAVQLCQYKGDYFLKTKGMPSGVIMTLIMNSIANSVLMRWVFHVLTNKMPDEFRKHVRLATVGDDNIHSVSDEIAEVFTMEAAVPWYGIMGYTITPASKGDTFLKSMNLEDLVFVKRKFVLWDDGLYRAPLDTDSIFKAFAFETKRSSDSSVERLTNVFTNGQYESYLHGRDYFNFFTETMSAIFRKHELPYSILSFEELDEHFKKSGLVTSFA